MVQVVEPFRDEKLARALSKRISELFKELSLERLIIMHVCGTRG
jgi:hydrogenase maturation factor